MTKTSKKHTGLPWSQRVPGRNGPLAFPDPVIDVVMPGNPPGLLPRDELDKGVEVTINDWGIPIPLDTTETISLQISRAGGLFVSVNEVVFDGPIFDFPKSITLPASFLLDEKNEGPHLVRFLHVNWIGTGAFSNEIPIVVDKIPPNFPSPPGKMTFDFGLGPITDATLAGLTYIEGIIPAWTGAAEGDRVAFTWIIDQLPEDPTMIVPIDVVELGLDRRVRIPVSLITSNPDGRYCGGYVILDKAGNRSEVSLYDLIPMALGAFPTLPLRAPIVPEGLGGSVDREDAFSGVHVEFPRIPNGKPNDTIEITWGKNALGYRTTVGSNPLLFSLDMPVQHMKAEYGDAKGDVVTPLFYTVYRGPVPFVSLPGSVVVDFSMTGPENPDWPTPINDALPLPDVYGDSNVKNELIAADEDKRVYATIELVTPLADDDTYQVYWNGIAIGVPYAVDTINDSVGDVIEIELDWDIIRRQGNSPALPVYYTLGNPGYKNEQESDRTEVKIEFLVISLPPAIPQNLISARLTCRSLHWEGTKFGFQILIPPSEYLKAGMMIELEWKVYSTYLSPTPLPAATLIETLGPITPSQADSGFLWFVEPYDKHILPTWGGPLDQSGKAEVVYTLLIGGVPTSSVPSDTQVVLSAGSGTCELIPLAP